MLKKIRMPRVREWTPDDLVLCRRCNRYIRSVDGQAKSGNDGEEMMYHGERNGPCALDLSIYGDQPLCIARTRSRCKNIPDQKIESFLSIRRSSSKG
jgi:hypothetical protein